MKRAVPKDCWPDEEQTLLLKAALLPPAEARTAWEVWSQRADIDTLDNGSYRMLPLLYHNLLSAKVTHPLMNRLRGIHRYHWCRNQVLVAELEKVLELFAQVKIPVLLLKGAALIQRYYHDPGLRPMTDLDIFVGPEHVRLAVDTLREGGWSADFPTELEGMDRIGRKLRHGTSFTNHRGSECDLHWSLLAYEGAWREWEDFYERSEPVFVKTQPARILCATDQLLHTCLHGGRYNELHPMRWIGDALYILRQEGEQMEWDRLMKRARDMGMFQVLKETALYLRNEFGASIPPGVAAALERSEPSFRERMEYRYSSARVEGLHHVCLRAWFQLGRIHPERSSLYRLLAFPAYVKNMGHVESWGELPGHLWGRFLLRTGLRSQGGEGEAASAGTGSEGTEEGETLRLEREKPC